jgi:hypothetical protein
MADSDKNIRITTSKNKTTFPNIVFTGSSAGTSVLTLEVRDDNTVAFTGADGDVFSLDYNLTTGTIWSVNDKSGTPLLRASAGGTIGIAELGAGVIVGIGQTNPRYKLDVQGWVGFASTGDGSYTVLIENGLATGNNALSIRAANALRFYNSGNTLYTGFVGAQSGVNTTYTLPATSPAATGTSVLSSTQAGVLSWVPLTAGSSSGTVNSGTATYAAFYSTTSTAVSENANLQFTGTGLSVGGTINSTSTTSGSLYVRGGVGITGNAFIGGTTNITSSQASISTASGALVVAGGVGIGGSLYTATSVPSSISGVVFNNAFITSGTWAGSTITAFYGGTGLQGPNAIGDIIVANSASTWTRYATSSTVGQVLTSNGTGSAPTWQNVPASAASSVAVAPTVVNSQFSITTVSSASGTGLGLSTISTFVVNPSNNIVSVSGFAVTASTQTTSTSTGAIIITGGAAVGQTLSVGGSLNVFNGANYTGFRFSGSASTTYTLPPRTPTGTGTSFLSSSIDGVMAWVAAPTSGGSGTINSSSLNNIAYYSGSTTLSGDDVSIGNIFQYRGTNTGLTIAHTDNESLPTATTRLLSVGTGATNFSYRKSLATFITNYAWTDGDLLVLGAGGAGATVRFAVDWTGRVQIGAPGTGFTLPATNGTSGQVLTANTNGIVSWTTVTGSSSSGGTVYAGTANQMAYYGATGNTVGGSTTFTNNISTGVVDINHTTESTSTSTGALVVDGGAGIAKSLYVGTTLQVGQNPNYNIPNNLASFTSTVNSYNQLVIANKSNGTAASANLVVNNDQSTDTTFYGEIGMNSSAFSGSGALGAPNAVYVTSTSAPLVLGTTTAHPIRFVVNGGATDVMYISEAGTAISVFTNLGMRSQSDLRFWNSGNTFYAAIQGGGNTANYTLTLPTAPVAAGASVMVIGSDSNMYFAAPGSGIAFSSPTANTPVIRARRSITMQFCAGYTPLAAGPDNVILKIPDSAQDGVTDITYVLREFDIRVETPSAGTSRVQLEKLTSTGAFVLGGTGYSMIGGFGITLTGAGTYFTSTSSFAAGALVTSNDKLRVNWTLLNATHANFSIQLTMQEV